MYQGFRPLHPDSPSDYLRCCLQLFLGHGSKPHIEIGLQLVQGIHVKSPLKNLIPCGMYQGFRPLHPDSPSDYLRCCLQLFLGHGSKPHIEIGLQLVQGIHVKSPLKNLIPCGMYQGFRPLHLEGHQKLKMDTQLRSIYVVPQVWNPQHCRKSRVQKYGQPTLRYT